VAVLAAVLMVLAPAGVARAADDPLLERLRAVPGLTVVSETPGTGYRFFVLAYRQPADHGAPGRGSFEQRLTLLHRSADAPTVLYTGGYGLAAKPVPSQTEPAALLGANQVSVEHRFFTSSRPEPADWSDLTIRQEASDEHRIVTALRGLYPGRWIQTGASKGGMTSVFHRRFYPGDVDGVVAYVAPDDAVNPADEAYERFFRTVGPAACRTALDDIQREALRRRSRLVPLLEADAAAGGWTFAATLGTVDRSFEMTVLDTVWNFWQSRNVAACPGVPTVSAGDREIYDWIAEVTGWDFYTDQGLEYYLPYYRQAATQLGWADLRFEHLRGLRRHPHLYQPDSLLPAALRAPHQPLPMLDVDLWVRTRAERMLFVYGENDPWSAERFTPSRHDSHLYVAPGSNHGANISRLNPSDAASATATLRRWAGLPPTATTTQRSSTPSPVSPSPAAPSLVSPSLADPPIDDMISDRP
jgi:hypothetical protein